MISIHETICQYFLMKKDNYFHIAWTATLNIYIAGANLKQVLGQVSSVILIAGEILLTNF